ncbi:response regulator transcription factor [Bdellovibrio bacteriovorus]|uniref:response regulator transcription factor n=1 Tax=Bdellovibrio bacteriovorus TaxID=959 RepID=UPI0035A6DFC6
MEQHAKRLLLVEDDQGLREVLTEELQERGFKVKAYADMPAVAELGEVDWALLDLRVGSENGLELLKDLKTRHPQVKVVVMSGFGSVASAVKAMQLGAHNFIAKPVTVEMILRAFSDQAENMELPEEEISLARMEREYIDYVLQSSEGNITQAAKKLGLHRQSLQRKLRKNIPRK